MLVRRVLALMGAGLLALCASAPPLDAIESTLISESSDGRRLVVEVRIPAPRTIPQNIAGQDYTRIEIPGFRSEGEPGTPGGPRQGDDAHRAEAFLADRGARGERRGSWSRAWRCRCAWKACPRKEPDG